MKIVALMRIRRGRRRVGGCRNRICVADTRRLKEGAAEMRFVGEDEDTMMILLLLLLLHGIHNSSNIAQRAWTGCWVVGGEDKINGTAFTIQQTKKW